MLKKINPYYTGYLKGQFDMLHKILDRIVLSENLAGSFRSKKQYRNMLKTVLTGLAEDSLKRERFMETGEITLQVSKDGEITLKG